MLTRIICMQLQYQMKKCQEDTAIHTIYRYIQIRFCFFSQWKGSLHFWILVFVFPLVLVFCAAFFVNGWFQNHRFVCRVLIYTENLPQTYQNTCLIKWMGLLRMYQLVWQLHIINAHVTHLQSVGQFATEIQLVETYHRWWEKKETGC